MWSVSVVEVDLKAEFFKPGKPYYERAKFCLKEKDNLSADFILVWDNTGMYKVT